MDNTPQTSKLDFVAGFIIIFLLVGLFIYSQDRNISLNNLAQTIKTDTFAVPTKGEDSQGKQADIRHKVYVPPKIILESVDEQNRLVVVRSTPEAQKEGWLINLKTKTADAMNISPVAHVFKYPKSGKVFYVRDEEYFVESFWIKDIVSGTEKEVRPIEYPREGVLEDISIDSINWISPNERYVIFNVMFHEPFKTLPEGSFGDGGPIWAADELIENGYYIHDLITSESTFLAKNLVYPKWDMANNKLYYTPGALVHGQESGQYVFDLNDKKTSKIHEAGEEYFSQRYQLLGSPIAIQFEGSMGRPVYKNIPSGGELSIIDTENDAEVQLDRADWHQITGIDVSPSESTLLYSKTFRRTGSKKEIWNIYKVDLTSEQLSPQQITPISDESNAYSLKGQWIDETTFITSGWVLPYTATARFLVSIDTKTGEVNELTDDLGFQQRDIDVFGAK